MNNTINIWFRGEQDGSVSSPESPGGQADINSPEKNNAGKKTTGAMSTGKAVGMYLGKQAFSYATSHIGEWTQNTHLQNKVNSATKMLGYGVAIATNPIMGSIALATDLITSNIDYYVKGRREMNTLGVLNRRAGNVNRSRV